MERLISEGMNLVDITVEELAEICFKLREYEYTDLTPEEIQNDVRIHKEMYEDKLKELIKENAEAKEWEKYYSEQMENANNECKSVYNQLMETQNELNRIKVERDKWKYEAKKYCAGLGEIKIAEEQRLYIKLPCKVGDTVYDTHFGEIEEYVIEGMRFVSDYQLAFEVDTGIIMTDEFGKTVFLTREAAEQALKGGVDNE